MTEEPKFQAPPVPPKAPAFGGSTPGFPAAAPQAESKDEMPTDIPANNFAAALKISPRIFETKFMAAILGGCVFIGVVLGMLFFGGSKAPQQTCPRDVIRGLVRNSEVRENLPRCGVSSPTAPCLVYIVNHSRDDRLAEYFFDQAAQLTGRQSYRIRIDNQYYAKTRIPPGYIAQIKIPRL